MKTQDQDWDNMTAEEQEAATKPTTITVMDEDFFFSEDMFRAAKKFVGALSDAVAQHVTFYSAHAEEMAKDNLTEADLQLRLSTRKFEKLKGTEETRTMGSIKAGQKYWRNSLQNRQAIRNHSEADFLVLTALDVISAVQTNKITGFEERVIETTLAVLRLRSKLMKRASKISNLIVEGKYFN